MSKFTKNRTHTGILLRCGLCMMIVCCCIADAYALSCDTDIANAIGNNAGTASYTGNIFTVDYGSNGAITGKVQCSSQSGTNNNNTWSDPTMSDNLPDSSGSNCYCKLESYTPNGGTPQTLSGKWVFNLDMGSGCTFGCVQRCSDFLQYTSSLHLAFREASVCHSLESTNPVLYTVGPGEYLPAGTEDTAPCTAGNYCPGLSEPVPYDANNDQGLTVCSTLGDNTYTQSAVGASAETDCYKACTTANVSHSSSVTGNDYYGAGVDTCEATACVNGYHIETTSDLATCEANIITINWNGTTQDAINANNANTVEYGGDIRTPQFAIHIPGKVFKGWRFSATPEN